MVSFQIISYNKSRYLLNAVESILRFCNEPFEIIIYEGHPSIENETLWMEESSVLLQSIDSSKCQKLDYTCGGDNLGWCRANNWMATRMSSDADVMIQLCEDMFFAPSTISNLLHVARNAPEVGIVSADAGVPILERFNPKKGDVEKFALANARPIQPTYTYGSGCPFCMKVETWDALKKVDVWSDRPPLFLNQYDGALDESIDPSPLGWASDWDLIARLKSLSLRKAVLNKDCIYHYDHVSGCELDARHPGWTIWSLHNYFRKHPTASQSTSDDQCFQKIPWNPEFGKWCNEPWASVHQGKR